MDTDRPRRARGRRSGARALSRRTPGPRVRRGGGRDRLSGAPRRRSDRAARGTVGSSAAGVVQSALGNMPELFIALFALHEGLVRVVQTALVGSVIANSVLVLGIAFLVGGLRNGTQRFDSPRARMIATLGDAGRGDPLAPDARVRVPRAGRCARPDAELHLRRRADRPLLRDAAVVPVRRRGRRGGAAALVAADDGRRPRRRGHRGGVRERLVRHALSPRRRRCT